MTIHVAASVATETMTGVEGGLDVDVTVTLPDGREVEGEVTLLPHADGRPGYGSWGGGPDHWVSASLLRELSASLDGETFRAALDDIEAAAAEQCES